MIFSVKGEEGHKSTSNEVERIRTAYKRRHGDAAVYSLFSPGQLFIAQGLERELIGALRRHRLIPLNDKKILEVGCGTAWPLRELVKYGARPEHLCGVDLLPKAIDEAKEISPNMDLRCGNAETLPFSSESFDIVMQFTMFTSILDHRMKRNVAEEMLQVLRQNGVILWYDYFISKPSNRDVKRIGRREIMTLFQNCTFDFNKVTLAPPIARVIAPHSFLLCYLLEKISWLRTHYLVVIRKGGRRRT